MEIKIKEDLINLIKSRIDSEFRKHKSLDWSKIAAIKIVSNLEYYYDIVKKEKVE
jgi:hypothetical protein